MLYFVLDVGDKRKTWGPSLYLKGLSDGKGLHLLYMHASRMIQVGTGAVGLGETSVRAGGGGAAARFSQDSKNGMVRPEKK